MRLLVGDGAGRVYVLDRRDTAIGRDPSCQIRLEDEGVAEHHAVVQAITRRHVLVVDPEGIGVTRINGQLVENAPLSDGDIVMLGSRAVARFEYHGVVPHDDRPARNHARVAPKVLRSLPLSERGVASLFVRGMSDEEIGRVLGLDAPTTHERLAGLHRRLGTTARTELIAALVDAD